MYKINREIYYQIVHFVVQAMFYPWMVDDIQLEIWAWEEANIFLASDDNDIIVDIYKDDEQIDWGWWCGMEDWIELQDRMETDITLDQAEAINWMIAAKALWIEELCYIR
jgi:hypothetical protein